MKPIAILTIVSNNYLHYARTLMQSVATQHPEAKRYCVIVDGDLTPSAELINEFDAIPISDIGLPFDQEFLFQYTILELNTAVKPWAMQNLLDRGHEKVIYIDPDIYLYQPLTEVIHLLDTGANVVLTPHLLAPITDEKSPNELAIRVAGSYNLGFCAVKNQATTSQFLTWWKGKLARDCVVDFSSGIFVDQSWIDLVPSLFENVQILRHPGYNVAYWNLAQRHLTQNGDVIQVNQCDLKFFHFSGIDPQNPRNFSKHQNRFTLDSVQSIVKTLVQEYCQKVIDNGVEKFRKLPYTYARFNDGKIISPEVRQQYRQNPDLRKSLGNNPFNFTEQIETETLTRSMQRIIDLYAYFLGRKPDPSAIQHYRLKCNKLSGYLRLALGVGLSPESKRIQGWKQRLMLWPIWIILRKNLLAGDSILIPKTDNLLKKTGISAQVKSTSSDIGFNLIGYLTAELGIGEAARSLAQACVATNVPYSIVDVGFQTSHLQRDSQALVHASKEHFSIDLLYVNADQTQNTLNHLEKIGISENYKIGFWHWEQPSIPASHLTAFEHLNEVWVPSNFVYNAVAAVSPVPVFIIPHALNVKASQNTSRAQFSLPENKVLALIMYDFHSYQYRKNPQASIAAFRQALDGRDDAVLVVKTINSHHHPEAATELRDHLVDLPGTIFIDDFLTRQETWDLQSCCDLLISLHRAEGFGLIPAEMMSLGKPVVATAWSANMDFMTPENSMLVKYTLRPLKETIGAYPAGPLWAEADIDHAVACIRKLLDQPELRQQLGQQAKVDISRQLNPETIGEKVKQRLAAITHWHPDLTSKK